MEFWGLHVGCLQPSVKKEEKIHALCSFLFGLEKRKQTDFSPSSQLLNGECCRLVDS